MKSRNGNSQKGKSENRRSMKKKSVKVRRKKIRVREKVGESRNTVFSNGLWLQRVEKSRPAKAGAETSGQMRWKVARCCGAKHMSEAKCAKHRSSGALWKLRCRKSACRWSTFPSQNVRKTHQCRTTFGSWDVEKVHAIVAQSTFPSRKV